MNSISTKSTFLIIFCLLSCNAFSQSTAERVYEIFQTSCTFSSCHDNDNPAFLLDLEGSGASAMLDVYDNIVNVAPNNSEADSRSNMLIKPGDPARSFLFRKIQNGLDAGIMLHSGEGDLMPKNAAPLAEEDIELVRQWILYGAPSSGEVVDVALIDQFYNNNGVQSISNPPAMPDPSEGFQIHIGPYFLAPGTEREIFLKYDPVLEENTEVVAIETYMGTQSHHFIMNRFLDVGETICGIPLGGEGADAFPDGFRGLDDPSHFSALFQVGAQEPGRLELPYKTAFKWKAGTIIDLNSHYINANANQVLSADAYINVYTQESGEAEKEMNSIMIPQTNISIPANSDTVTLEQNIPLGFCNSGGLYLHQLSSHTHKIGKDYDIYKSDFSGNEIEHLFDASCPIDGVPGCVDKSYDYQHPPERVFENYYRLEGTDNIKHKAKYVNDTNEEIGWGLTSNDEMMIMFLFYVNDTIGLNNSAPVAGEDFASTDQGSSVSIAVLANDSDSDGVVVCGIESQPSNGTVVINENGTITYTPEAGFSGTDQFEYQVCDDVINGSMESIGVVNINVNAPSGLFDNAYKIVNVFPNPTSGWLTIDFKSTAIQSVQLLNIQGQLIETLDYSIEGSMIRANLKNQNIPQGMYYILVENQDNSKGVAKVIFQN